MSVLGSTHPLVDVRIGMYLDVQAGTVRVDSCNALTNWQSESLY